MIQNINTWKNKQLAFVFVCFLLIFTVARWDVNPWIQGQLDALIEQNHMDMQYQAVSLHGTTLELLGVRLNIPNMPSNTVKALELDTLQLSLDWAALASARLAALVHANNDFISLQTSISSHESRVKLSDILLNVDVLAAQTWYGQTLPAQLAGTVMLQGDIEVDVDTKLPMQTALTLDWQNAEVSVMQQAYAMGHYTLQLTQSDQQQQWLLQGGEQLKLEGNGTLQMNQTIALMWPLQGEVRVQLGAESPLQVLLPQAGKTIKLTGTLGQPQWTM